MRPRKAVMHKDAADRLRDSIAHMPVIASHPSVNRTGRECSDCPVRTRSVQGEIAIAARQFKSLVAHLVRCGQEEPAAGQSPMKAIWSGTVRRSRRNILTASSSAAGNGCWSKSVVEVQHSGDRRCAEAPRKISHQRFGPKCVAAVEIESASVVR